MHLYILVVPVYYIQTPEPSTPTANSGADTRAISLSCTCARWRPRLPGADRFRGKGGLEFSGLEAQGFRAYVGRLSLRLVLVSVAEW